MGFPLSGAGPLPTFTAMDKNNPKRQFSAASERNRAPILAVLKRVLPETGLMVEIGAGSGQHAAYFAARFPGLQWQPTEPDADGRASIDAWAGESGAPNLLAAIDLDVTEAAWPVATAAAMFSANMIHIAPWPCCLGLMAGAGRVLSASGVDGGTPDREITTGGDGRSPDRDPQKAGVLCLYGPFKQGGGHTAPSNAQFDDSLKSRDPAWGIRDLEAVIDAAAQNGLAHVETVAMPANNMMPIFRRRA
jgi:hypothetical protein